MDTESIIKIAAVHGPQRLLVSPCIPTWPAELADAFAQIEEHDRRVGFVLVHTDHRYRFAEATREVMSSTRFAEDDEARMGTLWGAEVWSTPRVPRDTVLLVTDDDIDPEHSVPGTILGITSSERLFP